MSNGVNKIILSLVGPLSVGKGTISQYLKEKHSASVYRFSTILRDIMDRLYLEQSRINMQKLFLTLQETYGRDILSKVMAKQVSDDSADIIIIDGVRREADIVDLKKITGFQLVSIIADQKTRWQRMTQRGENPDDNQKTFAEFQKDEKNEVELEIKTVAEKAEFTIDNNGTMDDLYKQVDDILNKIQNHKS